MSRRLARETFKLYMLKKPERASHSVLQTLDREAYRAAQERRQEFLTLVFLQHLGMLLKLFQREITKISHERSSGAIALFKEEESTDRP